MTEPNPSTPNPTAISQNPSDNNFLNPGNFVFRIKRAPNVNFFLQRISFPGISNTPVRQLTPFADLWQPGDHLVYNPLFVSFRVDEDLNNYLEIFNWMKALGLPKQFEDYATLAANPSYTQLGLTSEIVLTILNSNRQPNYHIYFHDAHPILLSDMVFDTQPQDIDYQVATTTFRYSTYDFERVVKV